MALHRPAGEAVPRPGRSRTVPARRFVVLQRVRAIAKCLRGRLRTSSCRPRRPHGRAVSPCGRYDSDAITAVAYVSNHDASPLDRPLWAISSLFLPEYGFTIMSMATTTGRDHACLDHHFDAPSKHAAGSLQHGLAGDRQDQPCGPLGRRDTGDGRVLRVPCMGRDRRRRKTQRLAHDDQYAVHRVEAVLGADVLEGRSPARTSSSRKCAYTASPRSPSPGRTFLFPRNPAQARGCYPGSKKAQLVSQHIFRSLASPSGRPHPPPAARRSHFHLLLLPGTLIKGAHQRRRAASSSTPRHRRGGRYASWHVLLLDRQADTRLCP